MKTKLTLCIFCGFAVLFFLINLIACKKDNSGNNAGITGKWVKTELLTKQQFMFNSNGTVEYDSFATDSATHAVLGYWYKGTGEYTVKNSVLTMHNLVDYTAPNGRYSPLLDLVQQNDTSTVVYTYALEPKKNTLALYFTCPPYANCIPSPIVYTRE